MSSAAATGKVSAGPEAAEPRKYEMYAVHLVAKYAGRNEGVGQREQARRRVEKATSPAYEWKCEHYGVGQATSRGRNNVCARWGQTARKICQMRRPTDHRAGAPLQISRSGEVVQRLPSIAVDRGFPPKSRTGGEAAGVVATGEKWESKTFS